MLLRISKEFGVNMSDKLPVIGWVILPIPFATAMYRGHGIVPHDEVKRQAKAGNVRWKVYRQMPHPDNENLRAYPIIGDGAGKYVSLV
jgi:hypothetical protein